LGPRVKDITEGLSEVEIKPEPLRYIICSSRDVIDDASVDLSQWLFNKVSKAVTNTVSTAMISGSGVGKPQGILHQSSEIPVCDTSPNTPVGQIDWRDLVMLAWQVPMQWMGPGASYLMNQSTFSLLLTMSDALGRPLLLPAVTSPGAFVLSGFPIMICTQFPDCIPGATPVAFENWPQTYSLVTRKAVQMQIDDYSAGFCRLYKWEARIGGSVTCSRSARLLRVK
jgi:HK97 family phage major capsid protein